MYRHANIMLMLFSGSLAFAFAGPTARAQSPIVTKVRVKVSPQAQSPSPEVLADLPVPEGPVPLFRVVANAQAPAEKKALLERYASLASRIRIVPDPRVARFAWINESPRYRFETWAGTLEEVELVPNGVIVTIRVQPQISSDLGAETIVRDFVIEKYLIIRGTARLVDFIATDPPRYGTYTF